MATKAILYCYGPGGLGHQELIIKGLDPLKKMKEHCSPEMEPLIEAAIVRLLEGPEKKEKPSEPAEREV